jgi:eukaryotic-like serine/threonine-protein kinase
MRDPFIGRTINRYEIREVIHKSDTIGVYKAYDTKLERYVLLKVILHSADYSDDAREFFLAEAKTLAKLDHDNVVRVLDFGDDDGNLYLISEYVSGNTLSDLMTNPMPWKTAIEILLPITDALIYAHSHGVIHRDLTPNNILIDVDNQPILSDFSLVRIIEEEETRDMTGTSVGLGSAGYISPEQGKGEAVDFRSDIYSLGVIFYEMVTGKRLFYATSSMEIVIKHIMANPPRPRKIVPDLPKKVEAIILKTLSKDPDKRYQSMDELAMALRSALEVSKKTRKPLSRQAKTMIAAFAGALLLLAVGIGLIWMSTPKEVPASNVPSIQPIVTITPTQASDSSTSVPAKTAEPAASKTAEPSLTPLSPFHLPEIPVLQDTPVPAADEVIGVRNATNIRELARWGKPDIFRFAFINHDQNLLAITGAGLYYLDTQNLTARHFIDGEGMLTSLAVSPDGKSVAAGDREGTVRIWEIESGQKKYELKDKAGEIITLVFSPDSSSIVFSDANKNIYLWSPRQGKFLTFPPKHGLGIHSLIFSDNGSNIYSGSYDFQIIVWDASGKSRDKFTTNKKINAIAISPDSRYLAAAMSDANIKVWSRITKEVVIEISAPQLATNFTSIEFLPNSENFVTGSEDGYIRLWNLSDKKPVWEATSTDKDNNPLGRTRIKTLALSGGGSQIAVMYDNGMIDLWNLSTKEKVISQSWQFEPLRKVTISPDDHTLAYQLGDHSVEVLPLDHPSEATRISGTLPRGNPISFDNKITIVQLNRDDQLNLYSLPVTDSQQPIAFYDYPPHGTVSFSPDSLLLAAFSNRKLTYWATTTALELKASINRPLKSCQTLYGQDGKFVAAGSESGVTFSDANVQYFCQIVRSSRHISEAFLPDGSIVAQSLESQLVDVWDLEQGEQKIQIVTHSEGDAMAVAISKDGALLAVALENGDLEIYNLKTRQLLKVLELKTGPIYQVIFSNDGKYIITVSSDGTLRFFGYHR